MLAWRAWTRPTGMFFNWTVQRNGDYHSYQNWQIRHQQAPWYVQIDNDSGGSVVS